MRRKTLAMTVCLLAAVLVGCGGGEGSEDIPIARPAYTTYYTLTDAPNVIGTTHWSYGTAVVQTQAELETIWATAASTYAEYGIDLALTLPPVPTVDFDRHAVAWLSFFVPQACGGDGLRRITRQGFDYTVEWGYNDPPRGIGCFLIAYDVLDLALLPKPVNRVTFVRRDNCSPDRENREYCN